MLTWAKYDDYILLLPNRGPQDLPEQLEERRPGRLFCPSVTMMQTGFSLSTSTGTLTHVVWIGTHPDVVPHYRDGFSQTRRRGMFSWRTTRASGFAMSLIDHTGFPSGVRTKLFNHGFDPANIAIEDQTFSSNTQHRQSEARRVQL